MRLALSAFYCVVVLISCNSQQVESPTADKVLADFVPMPKEEVKHESAPKLAVFNDINSARSKLSSVGIGQLGVWKDDQMGGYMSITNYYQFGEELLSNNLAYYLVSDNKNYIKELQLVLNINDKRKNLALKKFAEIVGKTYKTLNLPVDNSIIASAKTGKELSVEKDTHIEKIKLQKSNIESWLFLVISK